jgi:hypothetical protein
LNYLDDDGEEVRDETHDVYDVERPLEELHLVGREEEAH